jgi:ABC-2 type transport system permease protein
MLYDIFTIMSKELKEIFVQRGSFRSGITNILIVVAILGVLFPMQWGREWLTSPIGPITTAWLPLFMSMGLIADAFAGERERHTLETLLASRLSDQAILFGKILAAVIYGMGITLIGLLLGAITINISIPGAGFYAPSMFLGALVFSLLGMLLVTGIGVQVSLHASNVRQAYQRMSLGFMLLWLPLILGPQFLPEAVMVRIMTTLEKLNLNQVVLIGAGALLVIDLVLIALANARFQRSRLILD